MITVLCHLTLMLKSYISWSKNSNYASVIIYKSKHFVIINKEPDLKINSNDPQERSIQVFLRETFPELVNSTLAHEFYFPHRLDFATSGILCIPLHIEACRAVSEKFLNQKTKKYYIAIVRGHIAKESLDIDTAIGEDAFEPVIQKMCTTNYPQCIKYRSARTKVVVLSTGLFSNYPATKVLIRPITGRRHQIRVHTSSLGHTIVGDFTYSNRKDIYPPRMYLHSIRLVLPNSEETIDITTSDPFRATKYWKEVKVMNDLNSAYIKLEDKVC